MVERFGLTASEQLTCGCHVHVAIASADEGVAALDRIRPWLAPLLALSANSPFWDETDSGYASYRSQVWGRWPSTGPTERSATRPATGTVAQAMIDTEHRARRGHDLLRRSAVRGTHPTWRSGWRTSAWNPTTRC